MNAKVIVVLFLMFAQIAFGQYGVLETSFQGSVFEGNSTPKSIHFQANGKVLFAGQSDDGLNFGDKFIGFIRDNADGSYDTTFGIGGKMRLRVKNNSFTHYVALREIDDSNFYLVTWYGITSLTKLNADCIVDTTFGTNGTFDFAYGYSFNDIDVRPMSDGSFTASGRAKQTSTGPLGIAYGKYHADATLDTAFGTNGFVFLNLSDIPGTNSNNTYGTLYELSDGKFLVLGSYVFTETVNVQKRSYFLKKFNTDGTVDTTYGTNGKTLTNLISSSFHIDVAADGSASILGNPSTAYPNTLSSSARIIRFDANGNFINDPVVYYSCGLPNCQINNAIKQEDGKVLLAGSYIEDLSLNQSDSYIFRRNPDGIYDPTFGNNGAFKASFGGNEYIQRIAFDPNAKLMYTGSRIYNGHWEYMMGRLTTGVTLGSIQFSKENTAIVYPNPVRSTTFLQYELAESETISIALYDLTGKFIKAFAQNSERAKGEHKEILNLEGYEKGTYIIKMTNGSLYEYTTKIILE